MSKAALASSPLKVFIKTYFPLELLMKATLFEISLFRTASLSSLTTCLFFRD